MAEAVKRRRSVVNEDDLDLDDLEVDNAEVERLREEVSNLRQQLAVKNSTMDVLKARFQTKVYAVQDLSKDLIGSSISDSLINFCTCFRSCKTSPSSTPRIILLRFF